MINGQKPMRTDFQVLVQSHQAFQPVQILVGYYRFLLHFENLNKLKFLKVLQEAFFQGMPPAKV